jgi:hypothetical protein
MAIPAFYSTDSTISIEDSKRVRGSNQFGWLNCCSYNDSLSIGYLIHVAIKYLITGI